MIDRVLYRVRTGIACYATAMTIALEQIASFPQPTATETPTPLVRIRDDQRSESGWHPDELVRDRTGTVAVLVWDNSGGSPSWQHQSAVLKN